MRRRRLAARLAPLVAAAARAAPDSGTLAALRNVRARRRGGRGRGRARSRDAELPPLSRRDADECDDARGDAAARRPAAREGIRHHRRTATGRWVEMAAPDAGAAPSEIGASGRGPAPTIARRRRRSASRTRSSSGARRARPSSRRSPRSTCRCRDGRRRRAVGPARGDRDLRAAARRVPELRAPRPGAVPDGARVRRARPDRRGDGRHAAPRRRVRLLALQRRGAVPPRRVLLHARAGSAKPKPPTSRSSRPGARSDFYELALYKLGWSLYKQDFYEEALHRYMALLDYKLSVGYDFDQRTPKRTSAASPTRSASSA